MSLNSNCLVKNIQILTILHQVDLAQASKNNPYLKTKFQNLFSLLTCTAILFFLAPKFKLVYTLIFLFTQSLKKHINTYLKKGQNGCQSKLCSATGNASVGLQGCVQKIRPNRSYYDDLKSTTSEAVLTLKVDQCTEQANTQ